MEREKWVVGVTLLWQAACHRCLLPLESLTLTQGKGLSPASPHRCLCRVCICVCKAPNLPVCVSSCVTASWSSSKFACAFALECRGTLPKDARKEVSFLFTCIAFPTFVTSRAVPITVRHECPPLAECVLTFRLFGFVAAQYSVWAQPQWVAKTWRYLPGVSLS